MFASLFWNPSRDIVTLPLINLPIRWYGVLFATGFFLSYYLMVVMVKETFRAEGLDAPKSRALKYVDALTTSMIIATVGGARIGHILFYEDLALFFRHPLDLFCVWKGGLASHGAAIAILGALWLFVKKHRELKMGSLFDLVVVPTALVGGMIRVGNFINQELIGIASTGPLAITFGNPADGGAIVPRHPVQLYEAVAYLTIFAFLMLLWRRSVSLRHKGLLSGLFLTLVFTSRLILECFKVRQSEWLSANSPLSMGQLLSLPFIALGVYLLFRVLRAKRHQGETLPTETL